MRKGCSSSLKSPQFPYPEQHFKQRQVAKNIRHFDSASWYLLNHPCFSVVIGETHDWAMSMVMKDLDCRGMHMPQMSMDCQDFHHPWQVDACNPSFLGNPQNDLIA